MEIVVGEARELASVLKFTPDAMPSADVKSVHVGHSHMLNSVTKRIGGLVDSGGTMHVIFVGRRGMGKTHVLQMIMDGLADKTVPAAFAQEEYSIYTVDGFFARVLEAIGEDYAGPDVAYHARQVLKRRRAEGKPVIVFAENLHALFGQMESDLGKLRAAMQEDESFFIVGSALTAFDQVTSMSAPFYNFFEIWRLGGLDSEEIGELIGKRLRPGGTSAGVSFGKRRLDGLRALTGGNPRLVHTLCDEMLRRGSAGDPGDNLTALLDQMTPEYQNRAEAMPAEVRKIFDAMALADGPITPTEMALKIGTKNAITAAQISRMKNCGLVEPVKFGRKKETRYQIAEWHYRMWREFRRNRGSAKLRMLADFLKLWYSEERPRLKRGRAQDGPESGRQKADAAIMPARAHGALAAADRHGVAGPSEAAGEFCPSGEADRCRAEIEKRAETETNEALRLCGKIIATDLESKICDPGKRRAVADAVLAKMRQLEKTMQSHPRIPRTRDAHLLLGEVADIAWKYGEWAMAEKASGAAMGCIPGAYCHGCAMRSVSANACMGEYGKSSDLIRSALRRFAGKMEGDERSDLLSCKIRMHSEAGDREGVSACSAGILEHDVRAMGSVVSAYFGLGEPDKAREIARKHIRRLDQSKSGDLEAAAEDVLAESVMHVLRKRPDGRAAEAVAECLKALEPAVSPGMFWRIAEILINLGCSMGEIREVTKILSEAFADSQMGPIRILKCAAEYVATEDAGLFEKLHQEHRSLAFSIIREMSPSVKIPQHVLDSAV